MYKSLNQITVHKFIDAYGIKLNTLAHIFEGIAMIRRHPSSGRFDAPLHVASIIIRVEAHNDDVHLVVIPCRIAPFRVKTNWLVRARECWEIRLFLKYSPDFV